MTPIDDRLNDAIRSAMAELADAAPLPIPAEALPNRRSRTAMTRPARSAMVGAALAAVGVLIWIAGPGARPAARLHVSSEASQSTDVASTAEAPASTIRPTSGTEPVGTATPVTGEAASGTDVIEAPVVLPPGWTVWDANAFVLPAGQDRVEQAFGARDPSTGRVERGFYVRITTSLAVVDGTTTVRGQPGQWIAVNGPGSRDGLTWNEASQSVVVSPAGLSHLETEQALAALSWRADPAQGFDPASSDLPLLDEAVTTSTQVDTGMVYRASPVGGPLLDPTDPQPPLSAQRAVRITVAPRSFDARTRVATRMFGTLDPDSGVVVLDAAPALGIGLVAALADGDIALIDPSADIDQAAVDALARSFRPTPAGAERAAVAASPVLGTPRLIHHAYVVDLAMTIEQRGTTFASLCLVSDGTQNCRFAGVFSPMRDITATSVTTVSIGGRWFVLGAQPSTEQPIDIFAWRDDLPVSLSPSDVAPFPVSATVVGGTRLWVVEVPTGVDLVTAAIPRDGSLVWVTTPPARPVFARPPW